jgi:NADH-quinone oxidoreductase subunit E
MPTVKSVETILKEHPNAGRDHLIPILQEVQESEGYLSQESITKVGKALELPSSKIFGVATFFNMFRFQPKGKYHVMVCRGTACHVKGSGKALDMVTKTLKIQPGETTRDKMFSLEIVACMGACGLAPVVNINGQFYAKVSPMKLQRIIDECREKEQTHANA